jgi:hypothetical protein
MREASHPLETPKPWLFRTRVTHSSATWGDSTCYHARRRLGSCPETSGPRGLWAT